jgi:hypothetical protein
MANFVRISSFAVLFALSAGAAMPVSGQSSGKVFRCEVNGRITFSDSVCEKAPDKKEIATGLRNSYSSSSQKTAAAGKRSSTKSDPADVKRKSSDAGRSSADSDAQSARLQRCKDVAAKLDEIKARQRSRNGLSDIDQSLRLADERQRFEQENKKYNCADPKE